MIESSAPKTIVTLTALMIAAPLSAFAVSLAILGQIATRSFGSKRRNFPKANRKTILLSGGKMTKALALARAFHRAGHRVILIESHKYWFTGHRFSNAVDRFYTVPEADQSNYAESLLDIIKRENVSVYIPVCSPLSSRYDSEAALQLSPYCEVVHVSPENIERLDDKYQFAKASQRFGLRVPKTFRITDPQQVIDFDFSNEARPFILKSIAYDAVRRMDLTKMPRPSPIETKTFVHSLPISESNPWILQEFIKGQEYCTHGTMRGGNLTVHCCCKSSAFQINYENMDIPEIESWVRHFSKCINLSGQASFDFIQADDDGQIYAIECNPRTHSAITMFYDQPGLAGGYLKNRSPNYPVKPLSDSRPTFWIYHEIWRILKNILRPQTIIRRVKTIARGKDAVFDWRDPVPFFMLHHLHVPMLLLQDLVERRGWLRIDFNIGKLVQQGGD